MQLVLVLAGSIAQAASPAGQTESGQQSPPMHMEVDWDLGVSGHSQEPIDEIQVC